ncbi:MAG: hypothetical protein H6623_05475 [Bdellovibrionaceae bacterium]|nr:hypothetical protein [Pseudobdellovibrionaceae bacterium]
MKTGIYVSFFYWNNPTMIWTKNIPKAAIFFLIILLLLPEINAQELPEGFPFSDTAKSSYLIAEVTNTYGIRWGRVNRNRVRCTRSNHYCRSQRRGRRRGGKCNSGCGFSMNGLSGKMRSFVRTARGYGANPISCVRSQSCQNRLRACYERRGQAGRAASKSMHSSGRACDFPRKQQSRVARARRQHPGVAQLTHKRSQGGGLHEYH